MTSVWPHVFKDAINSEQRPKSHPCSYPHRNHTKALCNPNHPRAEPNQAHFQPPQSLESLLVLIPNIAFLPINLVGSVTFLSTAERNCTIGVYSFLLWVMLLKAWKIVGEVWSWDVWVFRVLNQLFKGQSAVFYLMLSCQLMPRCKFSPLHISFYNFTKYAEHLLFFFFFFFLFLSYVIDQTVSPRGPLALGSCSGAFDHVTRSSSADGFCSIGIVTVQFLFFFLSTVETPWDWEQSNLMADLGSEWKISTNIRWIAD